MSKSNLGGLGKQDVRPDDKGILYDRGTVRVVAFACLIIVLAVMLTGGISYFITRNAVVEKLKSRDLVIVVDSIASKIDDRIARAKETALILAKDPTIIQWVVGAETDARLGEYSKIKINDIAKEYDYANAFVVSAVTRHYWSEGSKLLQVMSETDPNARWFFDALKSGKAISLNIDYNSGRQDTFVFLNSLVGDVGNPVAVAGVGMSIKELAQEMQRYKFGDKSNLWLADGTGKIHLSDDFRQNGQYLNDFVPPEVSFQILGESNKYKISPQVLEYVDKNGEIVDLVFRATKSTDWKLVYQIPRSESIAILGNIKLYTVLASLISILVMIFIFYVVSRRIADPLKRALQLTQEMDEQVQARTVELAEKNRKIIDSIDYAKRLQEAALAPQEELRSVLGEFFVLWKPRDIVGGDFYWVKRIDNATSLFALADCTGHGVPGAFMTIAVNTILNHIVAEGYTKPSDILAELNRRVKATLHRNDHDQMTDDGLDIGICLLGPKQRLIFAGARMQLFIRRENQVKIIAGDKKSIGYRRSRNDLAFTDHEWDVQTDDRFYMTTDGYLDQNGGEKDFSMGKSRFLQIIVENDVQEMSRQKQGFEQALSEYMGSEPQRDDITVVGFALRELEGGN